MSVEVDRRCASSGILPFLPRLHIPNPLAWLPRPRILGGSRVRTKRSNVHVASASLAMSDSLLSSGAAASHAPAPAKVPLKPASDVLCGALARAASQSTIHPLDTLKVRLQAGARQAAAAAAQQGSAAAPAGLSKIGKLVPPAPGGTVPVFDPRALGASVASLYRGVLGAASGAGIAIGAYFAIYGAACNLISRRTDLSPGGIAFVAGGIAAVGSSVVKVPLAVCIRSVQAGVYPNVMVAASSIVGAAGPRGLFTGFVPTVLEDVPDMAIKFAAYESLRQVHQRLNNGRVASPQEDFVMGATSGALAAACTTPLDVIKTNMMCAAASRPTMVDAARGVLASGGPSAFFRGIGARALSNGINSAVFFCFFEALRSSVAQHKQRRAQEAAAAQQAAAAVLKPALALAPMSVQPVGVVARRLRVQQKQVALASLSLALAPPPAAKLRL